LSFLELPRVVEIIPEQLLLDQKIIELEEALRNVSGVINYKMRRPPQEAQTRITELSLGNT
ncbi:MAG: hypothetical protein HRU22_14380, partial [Gammaproteobacteria bacterium]|nr:hypothetical protein [Gammaproteobacteria bacterium]